MPTWANGGEDESEDSSKHTRSKTSFFSEWGSIAQLVGMVVTLSTLATAVLYNFASISLDKRMAEHAIVDAKAFTSVFESFSAALATLDKRITVLEHNCTEAKAQRDALQLQLNTTTDSLHTWRTNCAQKMAAIEEYIRRDSEQMNRLYSPIPQFQQPTGRP